MAIEKRIGAYSAYAIACENGFEGTVEEWLESLIGKTGAQGWSVKSAKISADGKLIFTIENPATGEIKDLPSLDIDELDAIEAIEGAQNAGVQAVKDAETAAAETITNAQTAGIQAVKDAQTAAINAVEEAQTQATEAVDTAKTQAIQGINATGENVVNSVNTAGTQAASDAQTAITTAKNQAVTDVQNAGQSAVNAVEDTKTAGLQAVEDAQTNAVQAVDTAKNSAVQAVENAGTAEAEKISGILPVPTEADAGKVPVVKPDGSGYELGSQIDDVKTSLDTTWSSENVVSRLCAPFEVSDSIVTCNPVESSQLNVLVQIKPVQEGAGDPSPENVRPIRGWDVVNVWRGGKNLIGGDLVVNTLSETSPKWGYTTETLPIGEYTWRAQYSGADTNALYIYIKALYKDGSVSSTSYITTSEGVIYKDGTISMEKPGKIFVYSASKDGNTEENSRANLQKINLHIEAGTGSSSYEPYRGGTFTIPLGQTVYGGTLDVGSGVLTVMRKGFILNTSSISALPSLFGPISTQTDPVLVVNTADGVNDNTWLCSTFKDTTKTPMEDLTCYTSRVFFGIGRFALRNSKWASKEDALSWLDAQEAGGKPVQMVYPLAARITVQLTPQEILALSGVNTVYADAGDVTVSGYSDPNAIINSLADRIAALEHNAIGG